MSSSSPELSIIIPLMNEEENIPELIPRVCEALNTLARSYEVILIDDGSTDRTWELLKKVRGEDERIRLIRFRKNFGQTAALKAGFDASRGKVIVTLDGDLQNDPRDIGKLLGALEEGYDIVSGWRYPRQDPFLSRRLPSIIANGVISLTTQVKLHDYGCTLKAFRAEVAKNLDLYGEMHRFIPAIASWMGVTVAEVKVSHQARKRGKSKYGISRTLKVLLDLITVKFLLSYSTKPIQIFGLMGLLTGGAGFLLSIYLAFVRLFLHHPIGGRPLLLLSVLLIFIGIQFITMGLLAEIQIRTYHESQKKSIYVIKEEI
ncbi:MAG: glycosyltransferase family 2 protein [Chlamydiae bacterium]|nr:glycosyltransferase family 2 protein [Chlamydiota bacterium]MBI3266392.1 glycosyltransferase family 2 protein [Chlamydiota bacterium]